MTVGDRIRMRRKELGLSADVVADKLNVDRSTIFRYERGAITKVPSEVLAQIAQVLYTSPAYLLGLSDNENKEYNFDNIFPIDTKRFPLLGSIACGEPMLAEEHIELYVESCTNVEADFCLRCKGDSMINARIYDGDIVFVRKQPMVSNGEIAAVIINDEATLKRVFYYPEKEKLILQAENPKYEPFVYVGNELNDIRIIGKAVAFQSDIK